MTFTQEISAQLDKPIDLNRVKSRQGSGGRSLSYIEGHDAIRTANTIFGFGGWSTDVVELVCLGSEPRKSGQGKDGFGVGYRATVRVTVGDNTFTDTGFGDAVEYTGSQIAPHELASKEAVTDALKRCLMHYGDQFGLSLYSKDGPHPVASERAATTTTTASSSAVISENQGKRLYAISRTANMPTEKLKELVRDLAGVEHSNEIPRAMYDLVCSAVEGWTPDAPSPSDSQADDGIPF